MKKLLTILLCIPLIFSSCKKEDDTPAVNNTGPKTYVPDDGFEQELIDRGYDNVLDDYVLTANISSVTNLGFDDNTVSDLTGIEDFTALENLYCPENNLTSLDISKNTNLTTLNVYSNQLTNLDLRNGKSNYIGYMSVIAGLNNNLTCVSVDDVDWANETLGPGSGYFLPQPTFSNNCN
jgi:Leucine-rich repeat (LRR) protein